MTVLPQQVALEVEHLCWIHEDPAVKPFLGFHVSSSAAYLVVHFLFNIAFQSNSRSIYIIFWLNYHHFNFPFWICVTIKFDLLATPWLLQDRGRIWYLAGLAPGAVNHLWNHWLQRLPCWILAMSPWRVFIASRLCIMHFPEYDMWLFPP